MSYTPTAYTTTTAVKRILRTSKTNLNIDNTESADLSPVDLDEYVLDASRVIDMTIREACLDAVIPLSDYAIPEIQLIAPRLTAYMIFRDLYRSNDAENDLPTGPKGWLKESQEYLRKFIDNINKGVYSDLSSAKGGPRWESVLNYFQTQIGVSNVHGDDNLENNVLDKTPITSGDNITPWSEDT